MIISISGVPGSGKTSAAKILAQQLNYPFYSMGDLRGKMALERGLTINQLNALGEQDASTDTTIDAYQRELGTKEHTFVIEGRLSWYFIPHSFKILLQCDGTEAARRIYQASQTRASERHDEPTYPSIEAAQASIDERIQSDHLRYRKHYQIENYLDPAHYDLILDTTKMNGPEETAKKILDHIKQQPPS